MALPMSTVLLLYCMYSLIWSIDAKEIVDLIPCPETSAPLGCILVDTTNDVYHFQEDIKANLIVKLPVSLLTELWFDQGRISIVTASGGIVNDGRQIINKLDGLRWALEFNFQQIDNDYGKLTISLNIENVQYRDERPLRVELKTENTTFQTMGKNWIRVQRNNIKRTTTHETQVLTTWDNFGSEDELAILQAKYEALEREKNDVKNDLIDSLAKYAHCLESNKGVEENVTQTYMYKPNSLDINACMIAVFGLTLLALYIYWNYKNVSRPMCTYKNNHTDQLYMKIELTTHRPENELSEIETGGLQ